MVQKLSVVSVLALVALAVATSIVVSTHVLGGATAPGSGGVLLGSPASQGSVRSTSTTTVTLQASNSTSGSPAGQSSTSSTPGSLLVAGTPSSSNSASDNYNDDGGSGVGGLDG